MFCEYDSYLRYTCVGIHKIVNLSFLYYTNYWSISDYFAEKGRDLTQSYDKSPYTIRNAKREKWQHKQCHKKVGLHSGCGPTYYRTVSLGNYGHPTGVVNRFTGPTFPLPATTGSHFWCYFWMPLLISCISYIFNKYSFWAGSIILGAKCQN